MITTHHNSSQPPVDTGELFLFVPSMSAHCPARGLLRANTSCDNRHMEELIKTLFGIGLPADEVHRVMEYYREDLNGLRHYVAYMRALFDDRHEFVD